MEWLFKVFIKNREDVHDEKVRNSYGVFCGITGICLNFLLFAFKLIAGLVTGSIGIIADSMNNISDAGSSSSFFVVNNGRIAF